MLVRMFGLMVSLIFWQSSVFALTVPNHVTTPLQQNFLALADLHFDPFIACKNKIPCPLIESLRKAPPEKWTEILAANDRDLPGYREDSNFTLLNSALTAANKIAHEQNAKFVVVLGDFLGHDLVKAYRKYTKDRSDVGFLSFINKTMAFLTLQLNKNFPDLDVYSVIGNNDSRYDYLHESYGSFLSATGDSWAKLIKNQYNRTKMLSTFKAHGFYAVDLPAPATGKLLVMNSVLFSNNGRGKTIHAAAQSQLRWLKAELQQAKEQKYKVMILMHIPPGIDVYATLRFKLFTLIELWQPKYNKAFRELLATYTNEVSALFAGHLHADWFQILTFTGSTHEIPSTGVPAVSPIFGNNPGFKIYQFQPSNLQLDNFVTYYYPMKSVRIWQREYDFKQIYLPNCESCSLLSAMKSLKKNNSLAKHYKNFYSVSTQSQPITQLFSPYYWCFVHSMEAAHYRKCIR